MCRRVVLAIVRASSLASYRLSPQGLHHQKSSHSLPLKRNPHHHYAATANSQHRRILKKEDITPTTSKSKKKWIKVDVEISSCLIAIVGNRKMNEKRMSNSKKRKKVYWVSGCHFQLRPYRSSPLHTSWKPVSVMLPCPCCPSCCCCSRCPLPLIPQPKPLRDGYMVVAYSWYLSQPNPPNPLPVLHCCATRLGRGSCVSGSWCDGGWEEYCCCWWWWWWWCWAGEFILGTSDIPIAPQPDEYGAVFVVGGLSVSGLDGSTLHASTGGGGGRDGGGAGGVGDHQLAAPGELGSSGGGARTTSTIRGGGGNNGRKKPKIRPLTSSLRPQSNSPAPSSSMPSNAITSVR